MEWPELPIEEVSPTSFVPPHCPYEACADHHPGEAWRFRRHGSYARACDGRIVPRFRCLTCGRTFSLQSFSCTYYLKKPERLELVAAALTSGVCLRQGERFTESAERVVGESDEQARERVELSRRIARIPHNSVNRLSLRLGRHAQLLQLRLFDALPSIEEKIVDDGFETFAVEQFFPISVNIPVGAETQLCYPADYARHQRGGRLNPYLAARRNQLRDKLASCPKGEPKEAALDTLSLLLGKVPSGAKLVYVTDNHSAFRAAVKCHPDGERVDHVVHKNPARAPKGAPSSPGARRRNAAMWPVDRLHSFLRHSVDHHKRETIAFSRRHDALVARLHLFCVFKNLVKRRRECLRSVPTPAMRAGLADRPWDWRRVFSMRLFPGHFELNERQRALYDSKLRWPGPEDAPVHDLRNAH